MSRYNPRLRQSGFQTASRVTLWPPAAAQAIKSVQRGTITIPAAGTSATAAITAVDLVNTHFVWTGNADSSGGTSDQVVCRAELTNATTVTAFVNTAIAAARNVSFEVIEYWPGVIRSVQRGTFVTTASTTGTATISSVVLTKAQLTPLGFTISAAAGAGASMGRWTLTNATTVSFFSIGALDRVIGYEAIEWY